LVFVVFTKFTFRFIIIAGKFSAQKQKYWN